MTKPTTESGAPIEFEREDGDPALGARRWRLRVVTDDDKNELSSADNDATAVDLVAALQANPELRARNRLKGASELCTRR